MCYYLILFKISFRTSSIIPVDLNAIICGNLRIFAHFYDLLENPKAAEGSRQQFQLMREAIHQVLNFIYL